MWLMRCSASLRSVMSRTIATTPSSTATTWRCIQMSRVRGVEPRHSASRIPPIRAASTMSSKIPFSRYDGRMVRMVVPIRASRSIPVSCWARPLIASIMKSTIAPLPSVTLRNTKNASRLASEAAAKVSWARRLRRWVRVSCHDQVHTSVTIATSSMLATAAPHR